MDYSVVDSQKRIPHFRGRIHHFGERIHHLRERIHHSFASPRIIHHPYTFPAQINTEYESGRTFSIKHDADYGKPHRLDSIRYQPG